MGQRIGFIGVGLMGHGMAKNLVDKGFEVTVLGHRNRAPVDDLVARGAREGTSPRAVAEASDIVFLCVTGSPQVEGLIYGPGDAEGEGILAGARAGLVVVDCSTSEPDSTLRIAADLTAASASFVDAPLTRTPVEAEEGRLNTIVGAEDAVLARIRPALEAFCENIFHVGPTGSGHQVKLINNFLALGTAALITEALTAATRSSVDPNRLYDVVSAGGANSNMFQMVVPKALQGDLSGLKFLLANARKDLRYYRRWTDGLALNGLMGDAVHQLLAQACHLGFADRYVPSLLEAQEALHDIRVVPRS